MCDNAFQFAFLGVLLLLAQVLLVVDHFFELPSGISSAMRCRIFLSLVTAADGVGIWELDDSSEIEMTAQMCWAAP